MGIYKVIQIKLPQIPHKNKRYKKYKRYQRKYKEIIILFCLFIVVVVLAWNIAHRTEDETKENSEIVSSETDIRPFLLREVLPFY